MVAIRPPQISEVFLRYGQLPLGTNADAVPALAEIRLAGESLSSALLDRLESDDALSLSDSYGDAEAGDPATFDFMRITTTEGATKEVEVFNIAILMFSENTDETRRLFRVINAIKGEQGVPGRPATATESKAD